MPLRSLHRPLLQLLPALLPLLAAAPAGAADAALPHRLSSTGLYAPAQGAAAADLIAPGVVGYEPQYALWSDGAAKRRWLKLPAGTAIDGSDADAWRFPVGTRLWKEFSHGGRRIETRFIERRRGGWAYATYVWNADGSDAELSPAAGIRRLPVPQAPGGRYDVPSRDDCLACHGGAGVPVLGVGALQLSSQRDAPESATPRLDGAELARRGLLRGLPAAAFTAQVAAPTPTARAALGLLHANCGHCHHGGRDAAPVRLQLAQRVGAVARGADPVLATTVDAPALMRSSALPGITQIVVPGRPEVSLLPARMRSRHAALQMPPLGTSLPDERGIALVERWIADELAPAALLTVSHPRDHHPDLERPR